MRGNKGEKGETVKKFELEGPDMVWGKEGLVEAVRGQKVK